jgi:exopolysaccharide biosynthesis polyprenyl glycosylphosphotransferase
LRTPTLRLTSLTVAALAAVGLLAPPRRRRDALRRRLLAFGDVTAAVLGSAWIVAAAGDGTTGLAVICLPVWIVVAKLLGLYDSDERSLRHLTVDELPRISLWAGAGAVITTGMVSLASPRPTGIYVAAIAAIVAATSAVVLRGTTRVLWRNLTSPERTLILGEGAAARAVARKLALFPDMHLQATSVAPLGQEAPTDFEELDRVIVAGYNLTDPRLCESLALCRKTGTKLTVVLPLGALAPVDSFDRVTELPLLHFATGDVARSTLLLKRTFDVVVAAVALVLLPLLFLTVAVAIRLESRGPILFAQMRAGRGGRPFRMLKFRTMVENAEELLVDLVPLDELEEPMFKLKEDPRVTRVGRFLRRTSLDELPQLVNVLKGEMSLVGPRPEQIELVERYGDEHRVRLDVRPGMTGPMQVFGRGELTLEERLAVERDYVENLTLGRDFRILALTIAPLLSGRGAY